MVLGIGEGKILLTLNKATFVSGEPIKGKAVLQLSAPKKARALRLDVYHEVRERTRKGGSTTRRIVDFTKQLSGEKTYGSNEEYEFEALAPQAPSAFKLPGVPEVVNTLLSFAAPQPRYFVSVSLDVAMEFDISSKVQIQLSPQAAQPQG